VKDFLGAMVAGSASNPKHNSQCMAPIDWEQQRAAFGFTVARDA
jgi:hypothetical protein